MGEQKGPKLYANKPKRAQLKHFQEQQKRKDLSSSTPTAATAVPSSTAEAAAASYRKGSHSTVPPPLPSPPPQPPKESFARRYKFLLRWSVNLAVGAYLCMRTKKKDSGLEEEVTEKPIAQPVKMREPIPENQQRELYKWILEDKRKVQPRDQKEKKRIDEEKAILKQFIRAKSIPRI